MGSIESYLRSSSMYLHFGVPSRICYDNRWYYPPSGRRESYACYIDMFGVPSTYDISLTHMNFMIKEAPGKTKVNKWII